LRRPAIVIIAVFIILSDHKLMLSSVGVHTVMAPILLIRAEVRSQLALKRALTLPGIASFELDSRGLDIAIEFEVGKDRLEKILSLRNVKVKVHHLSYSLRKSKFACLAWLFKPLLRPIVRKVLEHQIATAIADSLHAANRELLYARERLRATRIADPQDLRTFVKAIITRLTPPEDPDLYTNVGIVGAADTRGNVFAGVYAPGSVVKVWREEAARADERIEENAETRGWRNEIFDVQVQGMQA